MDSKWDRRFLELAKHVASWSKDPSTQVGCVLANDRNIVVGMGYNGFPRGIEDTEARLNDRPTKYELMVHAEVNAILNANGPVRDTTAYCTLAPCDICMKFLIQSGVRRIASPAVSPELRDRWGTKLDLAVKLANEAGVELVEL